MQHSWSTTPYTTDGTRTCRFGLGDQAPELTEQQAFRAPAGLNLQASIFEFGDLLHDCVRIGQKKTGYGSRLSSPTTGGLRHMVKSRSYRGLVEPTASFSATRPPLLAQSSQWVLPLPTSQGVAIPTQMRHTKSRMLSWGYCGFQQPALPPAAGPGMMIGAHHPRFTEDIQR